MKILVVESEPGAADRARRVLVDAGHTVLGCDTPERSAPCRGLALSGSCPLDDDEVDVAVVQHESSDLTASERGALCAARARVPIVVAGDRRRGVSFGPGTFVAGEDLEQSCREAARSGAAHAAAIRRDLLRLGVLDSDDMHGVTPSVGFAVERLPGRLRLTITMPPGDRRSGNVVKAAGEALRRFDPRAATVDVVVRT